MTARPRLVRSVPFWVLVVGSVASVGVGLWLTLDKLGVMTDTLADGSATGVEVYAGQSWAVLGSILIGAGLIGLALALSIAAAASLVKREEPTIVLADERDDSDFDDELEVERVVVVDNATAHEAALDADLSTASDDKLPPAAR